MRILYVVQRYGPGVTAGSEELCRQFATRLAGRGHEVEVLTSCARSYVTWANEFPQGVTELDGVRVHRLPAGRERPEKAFGALNWRAVRSGKSTSPSVERAWMEAQGPYIPELAGWLLERSHSFDVAVFFTYLYYTTYRGLPVASARIPTVLQPTAHDEPPIYLSIFEAMFSIPTGLAYLTPEEAKFVEHRFRPRALSAVVGAGIESQTLVNPWIFRGIFSLKDRPYLIYLGRVDPEKGTDELIGYFQTYKRRNPSAGAAGAVGAVGAVGGSLALVLMGEATRSPKLSADIIATGVVEERVKRSGLAGALALVNPSHFESFSLVLGEAWAQSTPAIVQAGSQVLLGQVRRSGAGFAYRSYEEFESAVDLLLRDSSLRSTLGERGRNYVETAFSWNTVLDRYEQLLLRVSAARI